MREHFDRYTDALCGALILVVSCVLYQAAPVQQAGDSRYTMLLAENVLDHRDFELDRYNLPEEDYRLERIAGHTYYFFPPGSALLSTPFAALMRERGISAVRPDGRYDIAGELRLDAKLAALLMAAFASLAYFMARLVLGVRLSLGVAVVVAFGTQVFSTASRSMWSDTWGIVLVGFAFFLLLQDATGRRPLNAPLVGTLAALAYVVRPTNSLFALGLLAYIVFRKREKLAAFVLTLAFWGALFVGYSWSHFHTLLPAYFAASRLGYEVAGAALLGNLVSPSRGLLVYVPFLVALGAALVRYRAAVRFRAVAAVAGFMMAGHIAMLAGFGHWWGGHSYGARLTTSLVPCILVLGVLAIDAAHREVGGRPLRAGDRVLAALAAALCLASIGINAIGAFSEEANRWNTVPEDIDRAPDRLWSWARPQFVSPFVEPGGAYPVLSSEGVHVGMPEAEPALGFGWAYGEGEIRWTDGRGASSFRFSTPASGAGFLELDMRAYLAEGRVASQRVDVRVNGRPLGSFVIRSPDFDVYRVLVPAAVHRDHNVLRLVHPDATSPADVFPGLQDHRLLGIAVRTIAWHDGPVP